MRQAAAFRLPAPPAFAHRALWGVTARRFRHRPTIRAVSRSRSLPFRKRLTRRLRSDEASSKVAVSARQVSFTTEGQSYFRLRTFLTCCQT